MLVVEFLLTSFGIDEIESPSFFMLVVEFLLTSSFGIDEIESPSFFMLVVEFLLTSSFGIDEIESPSLLISNIRSNITIVTNCVDRVLIVKICNLGFGMRNLGF
jgi:hypothetical protein